MKIYEKIIKNYSIEKIISHYSNIIKKGKDYKILCPFHNDHMPSLSISISKQIFKCFSCGVGGNSIRFVMLFKKINLNQAIIEISRILGINNTEIKRIIQKEKKKYSDKEKIIIDLYKISFNLYQYEIEKNIQEKNKNLINFLNKRKIDRKTMEYFEISFAPNNNILLDHLIKKKYDLDAAHNSGLLRIKNNDYHDYFKNRLLFPIYNNDLILVGYSGRKIIESKIQKYLNSGNSLLFKKDELFFNYKNVNKLNNISSIVLVEGQIDVIAFHNAKINNCLAILGSSFSDFHANDLKKMTNNVYLAFDNDISGKRCSLKAAKILLNNNFNLYVIDYEDCNDADEFIMKYSIVKLRQKYNEKKSFLDYYIDKKLNFKETNIIDSEKIINELILLISNIKNPIIKELYISKISKITGVSKLIIEKGSVAKIKNKIEVEKIKYINLEKNDKIEIKLLIFCILDNDKYKKIKYFFLPKNKIIKEIYFNLIKLKKQYKEITLGMLINLDTINNSLVINQINDYLDDKMFKYDEFFITTIFQYKKTILNIQRRKISKYFILANTQEKYLLNNQYKKLILKTEKDEKL